MSYGVRRLTRVGSPPHGVAERDGRRALFCRNAMQQHVRVVRMRDRARPLVAGDRVTVGVEQLRLGAGRVLDPPAPPIPTLDRDQVETTSGEPAPVAATRAIQVAVWVSSLGSCSVAAVKRVWVGWWGHRRWA